MQQARTNWTSRDGSGHAITGKPAPVAAVKPGPEFANNAYAACLQGTADKLQQRSTAAQLARARSEVAALQEQLAAAQPIPPHYPLNEAEVQALSAMVWGVPASADWVRDVGVPLVKALEDCILRGVRPVDPGKVSA